jgi:hypothetical protein
MKKLILSLLMLGAMQLTAQKIEFEVKEINYGDLMQGDNGLRIFKFKNTGTAPLIISEVLKTCGCTSPDYTKTPIMPGEAGEIKVSYDTNRIGHFTKFVTVYSNDPENNSVQLKINGNVKPKENLPTAPTNFISK